MDPREPRLLEHTQVARHAVSQHLDMAYQEQDIRQTPVMCRTRCPDGADSSTDLMAANTRL